MLHRARPPVHRYFYTAGAAMTPEANQLQHSGGATLVSAGADALKGDGSMSRVPLDQQLKVRFRGLRPPCQSTCSNVRPWFIEFNGIL